jgi:signal transduction histidine kinase
MSSAANKREPPAPRGRWLRSIGARLTLWYLGVFIASTIILSLAASLRIRASMRQQIVATLNESLDADQRVLEEHGVEGLRRHLESKIEETATYVRILDPAQVTLFEHHANPGIDLTTPVQRASDGSRWQVGVAPLPMGGALQLAMRDDLSLQLFTHLRASLLAVWVLAVALGLAGGFLLMRRALSPVAQLADIAQQVITSGDLSLRVPERGTTDELDALARLFNGVLGRNQSLVRGMREALDNVAHDLRTPLTRLRMGAELSLRETATTSQLRDALGTAIEESDQVLQMLKTVMDISEAETGVMKLELAPVDLTRLAEDVVSLYESVAEERSVRLVTHFEPAVIANGDRNRLYQALANLIDNAIKYTKPGGQVELTTVRRGDEAVVIVADTGIGIAAADLERIWDRLFRADPSRNERGLGLGLSLVKAIVVAHGGSISVKSELGQGSLFTIGLRQKAPA